MRSNQLAKMSIILIIILIALTFLSLAAAQNNSGNTNPSHLKILAVEGEGDKFIGSSADLYLELKEGSGRVFLETTPLTKMDTQISTKSAKEIACSHFHLNCNQYDFIFTIKAQSNIIGGPSAGAAIAALTTIAVLDLPYQDSITITGTVNSGGVIGQVGGVKEKLDAAAQAGLQKVLIAQGSGTSRNPKTNQSRNLLQYGNNISLDVVEVENLDQVILQLTGRDLNHKQLAITENKEYTQIMQSLQGLLCDRTRQIEEELARKKVTVPPDVLENVRQRKESAQNASQHQDYYSAASYCFSANIDLKKNYYVAGKVSRSSLRSFFNVLEQKRKTLELQVAQQQIDTISDIQTLLIVKERLNDVEEQIKLSGEEEQSPEELAVILAYAEERYFSALSWMDFFVMDGKKFIVNKELLRNSCEMKLSEGEQMAQYVELYLTSEFTRHIHEKIQQAQQARDAQEYELCLITASQSKADANAILSTLGLDEENLPTYIESKRKAVENVIAQNSQEGIFPILGYSYYQYAQSLKEKEPYTSLLYLEYALEMSDLSMYFPEEKKEADTAVLPITIPLEWWYAVGGVIVGILVGIGIGLWIFRTQKQAERKRKRKGRS